MTIRKTVEPTGDLCIKFTEDEMGKLGIKEGDKLSWKETDGGFLLEKHATVDINISDLSREVLEMLIKDSCEKDISVNEVISGYLEQQQLKDYDQS
jgi:hypothetical protein